MAPHSWRNYRSKAERREKNELRFLFSSGLFVAVCAFCVVYGMVAGGDSSATAATSYGPIMPAAEFRRQLLADVNYTFSMAPSIAPSQISDVESCPGRPRPGLNLDTCTYYEVAKQNSCDKHMKAYDCEKYSDDDEESSNCVMALGACVAADDIDDQFGPGNFMAIFGGDVCYCPTYASAPCEKDSDCDGENGKTMCETDEDSDTYGECFKPGIQEGHFGIFLWNLIVLFYMFLSIAIVCDDLFVPALEIIAEKWELSNDVAGATLMAAGGSAPELFTAIMGVFMRGDLGFSTIVGSAVFNVLFVIGMCAMFTPAKFSPLTLTWWPLARDCTYYIFTLLMLVIFMNDGVVELWEAIVQFMLYIGYVVLMKHSEKLEEAVKNYFNKKSAVSPEGAEGGNETKDLTSRNTEFNRPSTFRAGVLQLLTSKTGITDTAGIACVAKIKGDVNEVFDSLDANKNGSIEPDELKELLKSLGTPVDEMTAEKLKEYAETIDTAGNGHISKGEFVIWYTKSEERIASEMKECFDRFDTNKSSTIDKDEITHLMEALGHKPTPEDVQKMEEEINKTEGEINFEDFSNWYKNSLFWKDHKNAAEEAAESQESVYQGILSGFEDLKDPETPARAKFFYIFSLPLQIAYAICVPDCRPPGCEWKCFMTFFMSIVGIGVSSFFMVEAVVELTNSHNLDIPTAISGMTIIAAGTSVPDLLSSVIVARNGHGDMAVSSSVGSNIFDVTVGIPIPWIIFIIFTSLHECEFGVRLDKSDLVLPTILLLIMVAVIIGAIGLSNWKMTHELGYMMFAFYFLYLGFAIANKYCFWISM